MFRIFTLQVLGNTISSNSRSNPSFYRKNHVKKSRALAVTIPLFFLAENIWAADSKTPTIGAVAETLTKGFDLVTYLMLGVCILMGISLIAIAFINYKAHRLNPKLVPLGRPVMFLILGLFLLSVPFFEEYLGETGRSAVQKSKKQTNRNAVVDIDAPLEPDDWIDNRDH